MNNERLFQNASHLLLRRDSSWWAETLSSGSLHSSIVPRTSLKSHLWSTATSKQSFVLKHIALSCPHFQRARSSWYSKTRWTWSLLSWDTSEMTLWRFQLRVSLRKWWMLSLKRSRIFSGSKTCSTSSYSWQLLRMPTSKPFHWEIQLVLTALSKSREISTL